MTLDDNALCLGMFAIVAFVIVALRLIKAYTELKKIERLTFRAFDQGGAQGVIAYLEAERDRVRKEAQL